MYCPGCSQQVIDEARFCSRCGLDLKLIAGIVARGGLGLPKDSENLLSAAAYRERTMRLAAKIMFAGIALAAPFLGLSLHADSAGPLFVPITVFVLGLCLLLYALFSSKLSATTNAFPLEPLQPQQMISPSVQMQSRIQTETRLKRFDFRARNTSDLAQPPSITDHTTKFLER